MSERPETPSAGSTHILLITNIKKPISIKDGGGGVMFVHDLRPSEARRDLEIGPSVASLIYTALRAD